MTEELSLVKRLRFALEEVRKAADRIEALEAENARLRMAGSALHRFSTDLAIHHQAILLAWADKASPDSLINMEKIRQQLLAASREWNEASGLGEKS